jgi:hypothetical protein
VPDLPRAGAGRPDCPHPDRIEGVCVVCGHCIHELILNGACFYCETTDLDPAAHSKKPVATPLIPASRLTRPKPPGGGEDDDR